MCVYFYFSDNMSVLLCNVKHVIDLSVFYSMAILYGIWWNFMIINYCIMTSAQYSYNIGH